MVHDESYLARTVACTTELARDLWPPRHARNISRIMLVLITLCSHVAASSAKVTCSSFNPLPSSSTAPPVFPLGRTACSATRTTHAVGSRI